MVQHKILDGIDGMCNIDGESYLLACCDREDVGEVLNVALILNS